MMLPTPEPPAPFLHQSDDAEKAEGLEEFLAEVTEEDLGTIEEKEKNKNIVVVKGNRIETIVEMYIVMCWNLRAPQ